MRDEPESPVLQLLRDIRAEMGDMRAEMTTKNDLADIRSEMHSFRADVATDFIEVRREISAGRKDRASRSSACAAVVEYHTSVTGHGVLISDLEARVRRIGQHFELPAQDGH